MSQNIVISYDQEADVVYLNFEEPAKAVAEEIEEGVFVRYHPSDQRLVGLTITNFSKKFGREPRPIVIPAHK